MTSQAITTLSKKVGIRAAWPAVGVAQAGYYRRNRVTPAPTRRAPIAHRDRSQPWALSPRERQGILEVLHSERFVDLAPAEVWATLLDEGVYLGSPSTFYRLLRADSGTGERRRQATHPAAVKPELVACRPNEVYSWDITKLHGPAKWTYYYLYVILDIYSRYVVGWMLGTRESAVLAEKLIADTAAKQGISRGQLTLHADRGSSMTSKPVAFLLADLGVTQSHSRPTTTRSARRSSRPRSTGPTSPRSSGQSKQQGLTASASSPGTTTFIVMAVLAFTRPLTSTTDTPTPCVSNAPSSCRRPTTRIQSGSSASHRCRRRSPQTHG